MCENLVYKHSETMEYVENWPTFSEIYKIHGYITQEYLGMQNFQSIVSI